MITQEQVKIGFQNKRIRLVSDPNMDKGTVCAIGDSWFYFGGETAEMESPEEYVAHVPMDDIIREITETLEEFRQSGDTFQSEYDYYQSLLSPKQINKGKA